ncbi:hypothetical protein FQN50_009425 [Emmonsiellopsis sp. PD_5]|nr:hypothetical protein FQN50_009425 [Emmonsiellopsis sp. PD_5]
MSHQPLNVIALISGGKDSLYSILHCLKNGHKIIALANLHPPLGCREHESATYAAYRVSGTLQHDDVDDQGADDREVEADVVQRESDHGEEEDYEEEEDLDSYMYQTVGHSIVPLYQSALGIPLYRAPIRGTALDTARDYQTPPSFPSVNNDNDDANAPSGEDETESLLRLLQHIMRAHPSATAVSAGAILSTYQRTRIENVAARLGLVPLAWLWMYPVLPPPVERGASVVGLLEDMAACGCEARIIKIASGGLDVDDLWGDVAGGDDGVRRGLVRGMGRFVGGREVEGAVLGEGGEYETIALDGPGCLWRGRIVVGRVERRVGEGGVAGVRIRGARCVRKEGEGDGGLGLVRVPRVFDGGFKGLLDGMVVRRGEYEGVTWEEGSDFIVGEGGEGWRMDVLQEKGENVWTISNLSAPEAGPGAGNQMAAIAHKLQNILRSTADDTHDPKSTSDIIFATVLLRSMDDFASMNPIYASLFTKPNPPARVCVACGDSMPPGVDVIASFIIDMLSREGRLGLHVQSRSYWAPANIGPYSQAQCVPLHRDSRIDRDGGLVYIAGQIPLNPGSMDMYNPGDSDDWFNGFVSRSVLSIQHMWRIGKVMEVDWWLGAVAFLAGGENIPAKAKIAWDIWEHANRDPASAADEEEEDVEPEFDAWDLKYGNQRDLGLSSSTEDGARNLPNFDIVRGGISTPPFFAVQVDELPRASDIEWQGLGLRADMLTMSEEETGNLQSSHTMGQSVGTFSCIGIQNEADLDMQRCIQQAVDAAKAKGGANIDHTNCTIYTSHRLDMGGCQGQIVPCKSVWGPKGKRLAAGIVVHMRTKTK